MSEGDEFDRDGAKNGSLLVQGGLGFGKGLAVFDSDADGVNDVLETALGMQVGLRDNDITLNDRFIAQLYRDLYFREPETPELSLQLDALNGDGKRVNRLMNLAQTQEFDRYQITQAVRLDWVSNGKIMTRQALDLWRTLLKNGSSLNDVIDYYVRNSGLQSVYLKGTNVELLHALEIPILNRRLTDAELADISTFIDQYGRIELLKAALNVPEFQQLTLNPLIVTLIADLLLDYALDQVTLGHYSEVLSNGTLTTTELIEWVLPLDIYKNRFIEEPQAKKIQR